MAVKKKADDGLCKPIRGVPPSEVVRRELAEMGRPVVVAFSAGKDSIAVELALQELGVETHLAYKYGVPGRDGNTTLQFIEDTLAYFEDLWQKPVHRYPQPALFRQLNALCFQSPERIRVIEAARLCEPTSVEMQQWIIEDLGLPADTWTALGVRAADSPTRRVSMGQTGAWRHKQRSVYPVWDWKKPKLLDFIAAHGVKLPVDYEMFGCSYDGLHYKYLKPVKDRFPEDYQQILEWFPMAEMEVMRYEL